MSKSPGAASLFLSSVDGRGRKRGVVEAEARIVEEPDVRGETLYGFWSDPQFDPEQPAFYYLRVLEIPTPRHTLYDAAARGIDPDETGHPPTIQERAYTSPIWHTP